MKKHDISVRKGSTLILPIMWEDQTLIYKPISAISTSSPVRITAPAHGVPDGWLVAVANAKGLTDLNARHNPPREDEYRQATVTGPDTLEFNVVNGASFKPYTTGGQIVYREPAIQLGMKARLQVKSKPGGTVLHTMTTENGLINLEQARKRISLIFTPDAFIASTWRCGVYDLEVEDANGAVTPLIYGAFALTNEVTTISN